MNICGVILAGGKSSRMGRRKELLEWKGRTLVEHLAEQVTAAGMTCLIVSNEPQQLPGALFQHPNVTVVRDQVDSRGPISGIVTAFRVRPEECLLVLSCDLPFVHREHLARLQEFGEKRSDWDGLVVQANGRVHPLFGLYRRRTQPLWEEALRQGSYRLMTVLEKIRVTAIPEDLFDPWAAFNANTPEEFETALLEQQKREKRQP
ncbi:molybdenum cofactor guanylyltransferase [Brevibacillus sp. H7]|uniref:molybdenum cofactor guanylyltransferase n=1 Tax=Brevibacillus sp. H7 TaxID=3349138 RepID=UPI0038025023